MKKSVFEVIKKQNGEQFALDVRKYDSALFEIKEIEKMLLFAGRDAKPLLAFLESLKISKMAPEIKTNDSLCELLNKAGYDFLIVDDLKKQQSIRPFFAKGEELCTFKDMERFKKYHILYLIKKGAEKLNRADFKTPMREDEYATSVMSIQMLKEGGFIKITNRYNHTVENPDNTFYSNPDYIALGLSLALKKHFNVDFQVGKVDLPNGFLFLKNKIYQYHLEMGNVFYGADFYLKEGHCYPIQKDYQLLVDNFILDFKENKIIVPHQKDEDLYPEDVFLSLLKTEVEGKKLSLKKENKETYLVEADGRCVLKARHGRLIYADLKSPIVINSPVFVHHDAVEEVYLNQVKSFAPNSFFSCSKLKVLELKKALIVPSSSVRNLTGLTHLDLSSVQKVCQESLVLLPLLSTLLMKNVREIQSNSLFLCDKIPEFVFYKLKKIGTRVMSKNKSLKRIVAPLLERSGSCSLSENPLLRDVCLLNLKKVGSKSLCSNKSLRLLSLNQVETVEQGAVSLNENLTVLLMNGLKYLGLNSFLMNPKLKWAEFEALNELTHCNCFYQSESKCLFFVPNLMKGKMILNAVIGQNAISKTRNMRQREG